jgi:hypothetical protein
VEVRVLKSVNLNCLLSSTTPRGGLGRKWKISLEAWGGDRSNLCVPLGKVVPRDRAKMCYDSCRVVPRSCAGPSLSKLPTSPDGQKFTQSHEVNLQESLGSQHNRPTPVKTSMLKWWLDSNSARGGPVASGQSMGPRENSSRKLDF